MNNQATILIVDDEPILRDSLCDVLGLAGYRIVSAADGLEALQSLENELPDLIIADIMMPRMNGYQLFNRVRRNPEWHQIPFIFLTAKGEREDIRYGKEIGADDYLTKPIDAEDLIAAVEGKLIRFSQLGVNNKVSSWKRPSGKYEMGEIQVDFSRHLVKVHGHEVGLSLTEFLIVQRLILANGAVVSYDELLGHKDDEWLDERDPAELIRYHVRNVRKKLKLAGVEWTLIVNVRSVGYRLGSQPTSLGSSN